MVWRSERLGWTATAGLVEKLPDRRVTQIQCWSKLSVWQVIGGRTWRGHATIGLDLQHYQQQQPQLVSMWVAFIESAVRFALRVDRSFIGPVLHVYTYDVHEYWMYSIWTSPVQHMYMHIYTYIIATWSIHCAVDNRANMFKIVRVRATLTRPIHVLINIDIVYNSINQIGSSCRIR